MTAKGRRGIFVSIYKFNNHIDWNGYVMPDVEIELAKKGELDTTKKRLWRHNCANLRYVGELPDEYDKRIELLINSIGGEIVLTQIISQHNPENTFILLEIPRPSTSKHEEGYISHDVLKLLVKMRIELHFWYV
jgi:hypothetical protein